MEWLIILFKILSVLRTDKSLFVDLVNSRLPECCKILSGQKGALLYSPVGSIVRPAELHSLSAEENCMTENVASLCSAKVATPPCAAKATIPCGLAVRKRF